MKWLAFFGIYVVGVGIGVAIVYLLAQFVIWMSDKGHGILGFVLMGLILCALGASISMVAVK